MEIQFWDMSRLSKETGGLAVCEGLNGDWQLVLLGKTDTDIVYKQNNNILSIHCVM